jgi:hypothetical protein
MPFRSEKQRRFMFVHHPEIAKRWSHEYGSRPIPNKKALAKIAAKRRQRA